MRRYVPVAVVAVIAVIVVAAILIARSGGGGTLTGVTWQLTAITEKTPAFQGVVPAADQSKYTIKFNTDGTFNAKADCNSVLGTYKTSGSNGLTITPGPSTLVACPDGSYGDLFAHALANAASYAIANDQLTITLKDGGTLTFAPAGATPTASPVAVASSPAVEPTPSPTPSASPTPTPSPTPSPSLTPSPSATAKPSASATAKPTTGPTSAPTATPTTAPTVAPTPAPTPSPSPGTGLTGKTWQLTAITEQAPVFQGVVPVADQSKYTITFNTDGTFQALADCNTVFGNYTSSASGALSLTLGPSSVVACAEGSMSDLYILGLSNAASYAIANNQLTITLRDRGSLVFK